MYLLLLVENNQYEYNDGSSKNNIVMVVTINKL